MKIEKARRLLLDYYSALHQTWSGSRDQEHRKSKAMQMVAAVDIGKLIGITPEQFAQARGE